MALPVLEDFPIPYGYLLGEPYLELDPRDIESGMLMNPVRWTAGLAELFRLGREHSPVVLQVLKQSEGNSFRDTFHYRDVKTALGAHRVWIVMELRQRFLEVLVALRAGEVEKAARIAHGGSL